MHNGMFSSNPGHAEWSRQQIQALDFGGLRQVLLPGPAAASQGSNQAYPLYATVATNIAAKKPKTCKRRLRKQISLPVKRQHGDYGANEMERALVWCIYIAGEGLDYQRSSSQINPE